MPASQRPRHTRPGRNRNTRQNRYDQKQSGHQAGDEVLLKTGRFLRGQIRAGDEVYRIGGDEFLVLLPHVERAIAQKVVARLHTEALRMAPAPFTLGWSLRREGEPLQKTNGRADQDLIHVRLTVRRFEPGRTGTRA